MGFMPRTLGFCPGLPLRSHITQRLGTSLLYASGSPSVTCGQSGFEVQTKYHDGGHGVSNLAQQGAMEPALRVSVPQTDPSYT